MSTSPQTPPRTTGAHRGPREARDRAAARALAQQPTARHEPHLDGLFTYCLSVLCDHDTAVAALGDALALAERRAHRAPDTDDDQRAWLYALARWACLRKLAEAKQKRPASHAAGRPADAPDTGEQQERRRQLARLAWPEAAGTTPEQREALELAVRHHLAVPEVAAVLGLDVAVARELLASAACEVERTRAALAVVESGGCPGVARLTGDHQLVLSSALRRELVRHVDDCPHCRRAAERAVPGRWPGAQVTPAELPVLEAPRAALYAALAHLPRARGAAVPRFDRRGFPMDPKDRAARRDRLRARAVTTTVVATVVAAPVFALWAAYRGAPTAEGSAGHTPRTSEAQDSAGPGGSAGHRSGSDARPGTDLGRAGDAAVSAEVISVAGADKKGAARLTVTAATSGDTTLITLTATGDADTPVHWSAVTPAHWLHLSHSSGTLAPGESTTVKVHVDPLREPSGTWHARVAVAPAGAVVSITGHGPEPGTPSSPAPTSQAPEPTPTPTTPPSSGPTASAPPSASPEPTPSETVSAPGSTPPPEGGGPSPSAS